MSSGAYAAPLRLELRPSRVLATLLCALHAVAMLSVLPLSLEWWWRSALLSVVFLSLVHVLRRQALLAGANAVRGLLWESEGSWLLTLGDGRSCAAQLLPGAFVHPWLVVLNFKLEDAWWGSRAVVLCADGLDGQSHRRLRVRLRLAGDRSPQEPTSR